MKNNKLPIIATKFIIFLSAFIELGMLSFLRGYFNPYLASFIMLGSGLLTGIGFLFLFYNREYSIPTPTPSSKKVNYVNYISLMLLFLLAFSYSSYLLNIEINKLVIEDFYTVSEGSDVIPQMGILVDRLLSGEFPYQWIDVKEWGFKHSLFPTYLPLTWLFFVFPDLIGLDYRWFAFFLLTASMLYFSYYFIKRSASIFHKLTILAIPFLFFIFLISFGHKPMFITTVETQIMGFYLFLSISLLSKSNILRAIGLVLCLLSRYALVLWIPLFLGVLFFKEKKKTPFIIGGLTAVGVLLIYVIPFLSQDWSIYMQGYDYHTDAAFEAWKVMPWQQPTERPYALYKGLGFGWWFYENIEGGLEQKVNAYRHFHAAISLFSVAFLSLLFLKIKNKIQYQIFLIGSFKIYLVVFYNFIQIAFSYLFFVPIVLSLPIIGFTLLLKEKTI